MSETAQVEKCQNWNVSETAQVEKCQNWNVSETAKIGIHDQLAAYSIAAISRISLAYIYI